MAIVISSNIEEKLKNKHSVSKREVEQCFENLMGCFLLDSREEHQSDPPTMWFLSTTNKERILKIVFIKRDGNFFIRTAYEPNIDEITIYMAKNGEAYGR
jgi:hypothetical protein